MTDPIATLPKVSLHLHLEGSVDARTAVALARRHGVPIPGGRTAETLYDIDAHADLAEFLRVYDMVGAVVLDADDFHRITYETLALASEHHVLHREMFLSPAAHPSVPLDVQFDGVIAGIRDAETDHPITCRLIIALNREHPAGEATELVQAVLDNRREEIIGIGLDYAETQGPPRRFVEAFALAGRAGLHRTAHSETGPPANIETLLDVLGCSRVDHGYHVITDQRILQRCVDEQITFTCTPVSSDIGRCSGDGSGSHTAIGAMIDAGLRVAVDSDDPPMFGTDPTNDLQVLATARGYSPAQLLQLTFNAVEGSWLDEPDKNTLRERINHQIADQDLTPGDHDHVISIH